MIAPHLLSAVVRHAESLAAGAEVPDAELLRRFRADREESAFAEIVRRHGPMVWAVCRQMLPNPPDAEDAFQATFLALVRSADRVRKESALGGWLHGVAVRVATKARRSAVRRKQREEKAAGAEANQPVPDSAWDGLLAAVHEEVQRLPDSLRTVFVLCDLQGVSQPAAAERLKWKPGTLTGRLCQARQTLLSRLAKRGFAPAVGGIGVGAAAAGAAVPTGLTAKLFAYVPAASDVPTTVLELLKEATPMTFSRTKLLAAAVLVAGGLATGVGAKFLSTAEAQLPGIGGGAGGAGAPGGVSGGGFNPLGTPGGGPPVVAGEGSGPGPASGFGSAALAAPWEYKYEDKPTTRDEFIKLVDLYGVHGWEFACVVEGLAKDVAKPGSPGTPKIWPLVVFKRATPTGGTTSGGGRGGSGGAVLGTGSPSIPKGSIPAMPMGPPPLATPAKPELRKLQFQYAAAETVGGHITQLLQKNGNFHFVVDRQSNGMILYATAADFELIEKFVKLVDVKPTTPPKP